MLNRQQRFFSAVTAKVQRRRETFIKANYPEYAGNEISANENSARKGKRLGGTFSDPSKPVSKLDGSEHSMNSEQRQVLDEEFSKRLQGAGRSAETLTRLMNEYMDRVDEHNASKPPMSEEREKRVRQLSRMDLKAAESTPVRVQAKKIPQKIVDPLNDFPVLREEEDMFAPLLENRKELRISSVNEYFASKGAKFVDLYGTSVASVVSSSLREYELAKSKAVVFDQSYRLIVSVSGEDAALVIDHFVTGPIRLMNIGDLIDTCIVDSKGYIMSTALVGRAADDSYNIILAGNDRQRIFQYLAQYVVYSRQSGMLAQITPVISGSVLSLMGPEASEQLITGLKNLGIESASLGMSGDQLPSVNYIRDLPNMTYVTCADAISIFRTSLDHFLISLPPRENALLPALKTPLGGVYALDMLRMEQGLPRSGIDIPPASTSPIRASLSHTVDQQKVREKCLFGHERISSELLRGVSHRRVALVASKYVYSGCRILSSPHRYPVGEITSCAWSPILNQRVCQAYVKPEYAREGNPVLVNLPHSVPDNLDYRFKKRITKQGNLQNVFRKLLNAKIVSFPIE